MSKKILITGAGGFVGKNLQEHLQKKYTIFSPRSYELDLLNEDEVKTYIDSAQVDFIIHCANRGGARGIVDDESVVSDNIKMFDNLIKCLNGNKMIFFGSGAQYNKARHLSKVKEEQFGESIPKDPYGLSKYKIVKQIEKLNNVLCLNIFGCYGKYEKENRFPSYAIKQNLNKQPITINQNVIFDYLYIDDLCKIIEHFIENKASENVINITPSESIDLLSIANLVNEISDFKSDIIIKNDKMNYEYTGCNKRLKREIPNISFKPYKKGLISLFKHLQQN